MRLDADQEDALREIVNVAMGPAGAALATALDRFVGLTIPRVHVLPPERLAETVTTEGWAEREVTIVREAFSGDLVGEALVLVDVTGAERTTPAKAGAPAAHAAPVLKPEGGDDRSPRALALKIGGLLVAICIDGIASQLGCAVGRSAPGVLAERVPTLRALHAAPLEGDGELLVITIDFHVDPVVFLNRVVLVFPSETTVRIMAAVERFLDGLGAQG